MCHTLSVAIRVLKGSFFVIFWYASTLPNAHTLLVHIVIFWYTSTLSNAHTLLHFVMFPCASTLPKAHTLLLQTWQRKAGKSSASLSSLQPLWFTHSFHGKSEHVAIFPYTIANPIHSPTAQNASSCLMLWFPTQCLTINDFLDYISHMLFNVCSSHETFNNFVIQLLTLYQDMSKLGVLALLTPKLSPLYFLSGPRQTKSHTPLPSYACGQ